MTIQTVERSTPASWLTELPPLGMDAKSITADFRRYFSHTLGRDRHTKYAYYKYEALVLTQLLGLSYAEAADVCGIPVGTVHSRLYAARAEFAKVLARHQARDARRRLS